MKTVKKIMIYIDIHLILLNVLMLHKIVAEQSLLSVYSVRGNKSPNLLKHMINNLDEIINQFDEDEETIETLKSSTSGSKQNKDSVYINVNSNDNNNNVKKQSTNNISNHFDDEVYIPMLFIDDEEIFSISSPVQRFPRWEFGNFNISSSTFVNENSISIMDSLIDFINMQQNVFNEATGFDYHTIFWTRNESIRTLDHFIGMNHWFPENLYVVDGYQKMIYTSSKAKKINTVNVTHKPVEELMINAINIFFNEKSETMARNNWPRLHQILIEEKKSFPFISQYSDFVGCNYHNWNNGTESIPLFTLDAQKRNCNHTFPFPSYYMDTAKDSSNDWIKQIKSWKKLYAKFSKKKSQAVWRGKLSGFMCSKLDNERPRYFLTKLVNDNITLSQSEMELFDVKITMIPPSFLDRKCINLDEHGSVGEENYMNQDDFQNYKAIIDVDGYAWSSRTASLMCFNSVILKIDPQYVEYYYYPTLSNTNINKTYTTLQPWIHYIPVKIDSSDLIEKTQYATNLANEVHVKQIISNANQWCIENFTKDSVSHHVLDIWEEYVKILDRSTDIKNEIFFLKEKKGEEQQNDISIYDWQSQWSEIHNEVMDGPLQMESISKQFLK